MGRDMEYSVCMYPRRRVMYHIAQTSAHALPTLPTNKLYWHLTYLALYATSRILFNMGDYGRHCQAKIFICLDLNTFKCLNLNNINYLIGY